MGARGDRGSAGRGASEARPRGAQGPLSVAAVERVLIADDSRLNQKVVASMVERLGFTYDLACNGAEAVAAAGQKAYSAILMDCQMPDLDGYEATARIREAERPRRTPIIALTASSKDTDRERCLRAGMDDHLPKPFTERELGQVLGRWTPSQARQTAGAAPAPPASSAADDILDAAVIQDLTALGKAFASESVRSFLRGAPVRLDAVSEAAKSGDWLALRRGAHSLRGSSAMMGARRLAQRCGELEEAPEAQSAELVGVIRSELARASAALEAVIESLK